MTLRQFIEKIRKRQAEGVMIFYDSELIENPQWIVEPGLIAMKPSENMTITLWERGEETQADALKALRPMFKFLIPVAL